MKKLVKFLSLIILSTALITGCKKKTVTGPQGDTGAQGQQGAQGNANVTNTTFTISSWTASGVGYASNYLSLPNLDSTAFVSGVVMSYFMQSSSSFYPLPFTDGYYTIQPEYGFQWMRVYLYNNDHSVPSSPTGSAIIRVVIIPPAIKRQHPNINYQNYNEVKVAFNLKD
jgi:hypothetical protein